jgi:hypothetical protein
MPGIGLAFRGGKQDMQAQAQSARDGVIKRVLLLYGVFTLVHNAALAVGFYLLPEGFMRGSPQAAVGRLAATGSFWSEFGMTLLINLGLMAGLAVFLNLTQVKGMPTGYVIPVSYGLMTGLILGTNSFAANDLKQFNAWEGTALGLSIGGVETLAYMLIIAATAGFGVQYYRSWWRWSGEWAPTKIKSLRDIRMSPTEAGCLVAGILMLVFAAYRETIMAVGGAPPAGG